MMPDLPRAAIALTHAATVLATFKASPQGIEGFVAEYDTLLASLFRKTWRGDMTAGEMAAEHRRILKNLAPGCYYAGMQDGGVDQSEADESDQQTISDWIAEQSSHTLDFAKAARDAGSDKAARDAVKARADMWLSAMLALGNLGRASAQANAMGTFDGDDGAESCRTCQRLKGQRHRMKWWMAKGFIPSIGNDNFECKGFRCQHFIRDDKGNRIT